MLPIGPNGLPVGPADQRAQIQTVNFAPSYTRIVNQHTVLNTNYFFRRDGFNYYPSKNPFADRGAPDLQQESIAQQRSLANTGLLSDITYTHGSQQRQSRRLLRADVPRREFQTSASSIRHI